MDDRAERAWRAAAEKAIGGAFARLRTQTADGVPIEPLYPRQSVETPQPWRNGPWATAARIDHPVTDEANRLAILDLEGGADALTLVTDSSPFARGFGLATADLTRALDGIELDFIGLRLDAGSETPQAAKKLAELIDARHLSSAGLRIDLAHDPIGGFARDGVDRADDIRGLIDLAGQAGLKGGTLLADGRPYHEAGASDALELAVILATGVAYLRRLEAIGLSLDAARDHLAILIAVDAEMFTSLAKTRAVRRLWARVEAACGLSLKAVRLNAETSWRMMTRRDCWTNVMRTTTATVAAGLGGADAITVLPFTLPLGLPNAAARRLARNVQRILIDEANLAMVDDAAAGSGGLEALTDGLCQRAWSLFQAIEAEGGIEASLRAGGLQARIAEQAQPRAKAIATLTKAIVGTSRFPGLDASPPIVLDVAPRPAPPPTPGALPARRDAEPFEVLRDRAEAAAERPSVFLATIGDAAAFGARATYAANFLAAGGLDAPVTHATRNRAETVGAFAASGARVACLCGTDAAYADEAKPLAHALCEAGASRVLLAGRTADATIIALYDGCDAITILSDTLDAALAP